MVKQYPFYSLDKLIKELPGVSRHSVQNILEKNNLSTIEKRLVYAKEEIPVAQSIAKKNKLSLAPVFSVLANRTSNIISIGKRLAPRNPKILLFTGLMIFFTFFVKETIFSKPPEISLDQPAPNFVNKGTRLSVSGKVFPKDSVVTINGDPVALNGDGTFTAIVNIAIGESNLEVKALKFGKESRLVRLITREPTEEEILAEKRNEETKKKQAADKAAEIDRTVNDLIAAKNAGKKGNLKVINNKIKEEAGFTNVTGEIINIGNEDSGWVTVTVNFFSKEGNLVDTKYGFVMTADQILKAGEKASFETQATTKIFDRYSLDLSWEPVTPSVAGVSTTNASNSAVSQ